MRLDIYFHLEGLPQFDPNASAKLDRILNTLTSLENQQESLMAVLDDLVAKVTELTTVNDSVVTLLTDLKAKLDAAILTGDPVKIQAISDALGAQATRLANAVISNTPVEGTVEPPVEPPVEPEAYSKKRQY